MSRFNYKEWIEAMGPYWYEGIMISEKELMTKNNYRIVKRSYKKANRNGNPTGAAAKCYEIEYLERDGNDLVWELESSHPTYELAKEYLGWLK